MEINPYMFLVSIMFVLHVEIRKYKLVIDLWVILKILTNFAKLGVFLVEISRCLILQSQNHRNATSGCRCVYYVLVFGE